MSSSLFYLHFVLFIRGAALQELLQLGFGTRLCVTSLFFCCLVFPHLRFWFGAPDVCLNVFIYNYHVNFNDKCVSR